MFFDFEGMWRIFYLWENKLLLNIEGDFYFEEDFGEWMEYFRWGGSGELWEGIE